MSKELFQLSTTTTLANSDLLHLQTDVAGTWRDRAIRKDNFFAYIQTHRNELDRVGIQGSAFVAASTMDISGGAGDFAYVVSGDTITRLGTATAGTQRVLRFQSGNVLVHNATYLVLPGGNNIIVTAGDVATFRSIGSGGWVLVGYLRDDVNTFAKLNYNLGDLPDPDTARLYLNAQLASGVLDTYASIDPSTDVQALLAAANNAAIRSTIGLTLGSEAQAWSANLDAFSGKTIDTDTSLAANSDTRIPTQAAVKAFVAGLISGALRFINNLDCSANPNYPAAVKGDVYYASVAGKVGGAAGKVVSVGDAIICKANNAGGTEVSVGASWFILEANIPGVTTLGLALMRLATPGAAAYIRLNDDGTATALSAADLRTALNLVAGTDVQAWSAALDAYAGTTIDTDVTLAANSDTVLPTQKAVKAYVDATIAGVGGGGGVTPHSVTFVENAGNGGDDAGDGSFSEPVETLAHALTIGPTISVGKLTDTSTPNIAASGICISGAGRDSTVLNSLSLSSGNDIELHDIFIAVLLVTSTGDLTIKGSNVQIDEIQCHTGITIVLDGSIYAPLASFAGIDGTDGTAATGGTNGTDHGGYGDGSNGGDATSATSGSMPTAGTNATNLILIHGADVGEVDADGGRGGAGSDGGTGGNGGNGAYGYNDGMGNPGNGGNGGTGGNGSDAVQGGASGNGGSITIGIGCNVGTYSTLPGVCDGPHTHGLGSGGGSLGYGVNGGSDGTTGGAGSNGADAAAAVQGTDGAVTGPTYSVGTWQGTPVANAYIANAATWNNALQPSAIGSTIQPYNSGTLTSVPSLPSVIAHGALADGITSTVGTAIAVFSNTTLFFNAAGYANVAASVKGVTNGSSGAAGYVGEEALNTRSNISTVSLVTLFGKTVLSLSLTAGDWDISGVVDFIAGGSTTVTWMQGGISLVNDTSGSQDQYATRNYPNAGLSANESLPTPVVKMTFATTTTVYLIAKAAFANSTLVAYGTIRARRIR